MPNEVQKYFAYSQRQRNGFIVLSALCLLVLFTPHWAYLLRKNDFQKQTFSPIAYEIIDFPKEGFQQNGDVGERILESVQQSKALFPFNPNNSSVEEFEALGLNRFVAERIVKYRNKGGKFKQKQDFKKIYGLSEADFNRLEPFIDLDETPTSNSNVTPQMANIQLFNFDPNTATFDDLMKLGLNQEIANRILNYRNKGGKFGEKADFAKIYGLSNTDFERLSPYIQINNMASNNANNNAVTPTFVKKTENVHLKIDINKSTTEDWMQLKGVGMAYASKIVNFREKLGGFAQIEQVGETWGLPDSTFQKIKTQLIASEIATKIKINQLNPNEFKGHPYLKAKLMETIIQYRLTHGKFKDINDLKNVRAINAETLEKIKPYLSFE